MKKILLLLLPVVWLACNQPVKGKNGVVYKNAAQYNDYIVSRQAIVIGNMLTFGKTARTDAAAAYKLLDKYALSADSAITDLKGMPPFKGDSSFREAAVNGFLFYKRVLEKDYKELLTVRSRTDLSSTAADSLLNEIKDRLSGEERKIDKAFHEAQAKFAADNHMLLSENSMQKEVQRYQQ